MSELLYYLLMSPHFQYQHLAVSNPRSGVGQRKITLSHSSDPFYHAQFLAAVCVDLYLNYLPQGDVSWKLFFNLTPSLSIYIASRNKTCYTLFSLDSQLILRGAKLSGKFLSLLLTTGTPLIRGRWTGDLVFPVSPVM